MYSLEVHGISDDTVTAGITLDAGHGVYQGHFPGFPLTPGVFQARMIRHIMEKALGTTLRLTRTKYIKWTAMQRPDKEKELLAHITYRRTEKGLVVDATLQSGSETCMKLKGEYIEPGT